MIHRLIRRGARKYGKARTLCGRDVEGQIHPDAEVYADGPLSTDDTPCAECELKYSGAVAESRARAGYRTVHVLYHGLPLCGFGEGKVPAEWPADHAWMPVTEIGHAELESELNVHWCKTCREKATAAKLPAAAAGTNALDHMRAPKKPDDGMRRFEVWSLRTIGNGGVDVRVGRAIENRDGSLSLELPDLGVRLRLKPT